VAEVEGDHVFEELLAETGNTYLKVVKDPSGRVTCAASTSRSPATTASCPSSAQAR
jgi:hypothetical protein